MQPTPARRPAYLAVLVTIALSLTTGCTTSKPSTSKSVPSCPPATRTAAGDLVPTGTRPCLLTTPASSTRHGSHPATTPQTPAPAKQPATPTPPNQPDNKPAERAAPKPPPAPAKKLR